MTDATLLKLRRAIKRSGLSARRWAKEVAEVDERTVRRWLRGDSRPAPRILKLIGLR